MFVRATDDANARRGRGMKPSTNPLAMLHEASPALFFDNIVPLLSMTVGCKSGPRSLLRPSISRLYVIGRHICVLGPEGDAYVLNEQKWHPRFGNI